MYMYNVRPPTLSPRLRSPFPRRSKEQPPCHLITYHGRAHTVQRISTDRTIAATCIRVHKRCSRARIKLLRCSYIRCVPGPLRVLASDTYEHFASFALPCSPTVHCSRPMASPSLVHMLHTMTSMPHYILILARREPHQMKSVNPGSLSLLVRPISSASKVFCADRWWIHGHHRSITPFNHSITRSLARPPPRVVASERLAHLPPAAPRRASHAACHAFIPKAAHPLTMCQPTNQLDPASSPHRAPIEPQPSRAIHPPVNPISPPVRPPAARLALPRTFLPRVPPPLVISSNLHPPHRPSLMSLAGCAATPAPAPAPEYAPAAGTPTL